MQNVIFNIDIVSVQTDKPDVYNSLQAYGVVFFVWGLPFFPGPTKKYCLIYDTPRKTFDVKGNQFFFFMVEEILLHFKFVSQITSRIVQSENFNLYM